MAARITRAQLRGKRLNSICKRAKTTTNEAGPEDNRILCYGFYDPMFESHPPIKICKECPAYIWNDEQVCGDAG